MKYHIVSSALEALRTLEQKLAAYQHAVGVLYLDATTAAPKDTARGRGRTMAVLSEVIYGLQANPENAALLSDLEEHIQDLDPIAPPGGRALFRKSYNRIPNSPRGICGVRR